MELVEVKLESQVEKKKRFCLHTLCIRLCDVLLSALNLFVVYPFNVIFPWKLSRNHNHQQTGQTIEEMEDSMRENIVSGERLNAIERSENSFENKAKQDPMNPISRDIYHYEEHRTLTIAQTIAAAHPYPDAAEIKP
ncbi:uncharacterized protein LOC113566109 [Drosophila persimilis]|uniref:uncharacterized protein LOC113566109 n=1 Tax=Drosophila persimilis TaxID=7234 RepID=UPI000F07DAF9|nr:uncharacterized protein LOC113566109 [Drosophila persimilis]